MNSRFGLLVGLLGCCVAGCITRTPTPSAGSSSPTPNSGSKKPFPWPNGSSAAVSLTYDDAIQSQLDNAVPALARHGLVATFFLTGSSATLQASPERYRALVQAGHELGSHTMTHPCDRALSFVQPGMALQDFDQARMDAELAESTKQLRDLGQTGPLSFAYPCGSTWIGETHISYVPSIEKAFIAARGVSGSVVDPRRARMFDVPSVVGNTSATALTSWVDSALSAGGWVVFTFHGVAGDYLPVDAAAHEALLTYLEHHKNTLWTERFGTIAQYISAHRAE
jgi:peptidoglycan/xylan/chitin deacetylase (PgdA/CDA1 family)